VVIDAHEGVQENSRRHGYLLDLLGIRRSPSCQQDGPGRYSQSGSTPSRPNIALAGAGRLEPAGSFPSRRGGHNIAAPAPTPWWKGPTAVMALDDSKPPDRPTASRCDSHPGCVSLRPGASGRARRERPHRSGERLIFAPSNKTSTVKTIERWNAPPALREAARASDHPHRPGLCSAWAIAAPEHAPPTR